MGRRIHFDVARGADVRRGDRTLPARSADVDLSGVMIERFVSPSMHDPSRGEHGWHVYVNDQPIGYVEPQVDYGQRRGTHSVRGWAASGNRTSSIKGPAPHVVPETGPDGTTRFTQVPGPAGGNTRNEAIVNIVRNYRATGIAKPWVEDDD